MPAAAFSCTRHWPGPASVSTHACTHAHTFALPLNFFVIARKALAMSSRCAGLGVGLRKMPALWVSKACVRTAREWGCSESAIVTWVVPAQRRVSNHAALPPRLVLHPHPPSSAKYSFFWSQYCAALENAAMSASFGEGCPNAASRFSSATHTLNFSPSSLLGAHGSGWGSVGLCKQAGRQQQPRAHNKGESKGAAAVERGQGAAAGCQLGRQPASPPAPVVDGLQRALRHCARLVRLP